MTSPGPGLFGRFELMSRAYPDGVAVIDGGQSLTYRELEERASIFGDEMLREGLGGRRYLPIIASRCVDYIVALLACSRLDIAYAPIDPFNPQDRINTILCQLGCSYFMALGSAAPINISGASTKFGVDDAGRLHRQGRVLAPHDETHSGGLVSVMFTSGTTGGVKGARITQRGLLNLVDNAREDVPLDAGSYLHHSSIGFDAAMFEIWMPLLTGARLNLHHPTFDIDSLANGLKSTNCDVLFLTTSLFHLIAEQRVDILDALRVLVVGGEILKPDYARALFATNPRATLINGYGPTENTIFSTFHRLHGATDAAVPVLPIGRPLRNVTAKVVDSELESVPTGMRGELLLGGDNLARGYLDDAQTSSRFVELGDGRYYRTGDQVSVDLDGILMFHGRDDDQVKIKGYRVETAEIEQAITDMPAIGQAVVLARPMNALENCLVAFVTFRTGAPVVGTDEMLRSLARQLPPYMLPARFHHLLELPVTRNGKVDRQRLVALDDASRIRYLGGDPLGGMEVVIRDIWCDVLGTRSVGLDQPINMVGASSLTVLMAYSAVNERVGLSPPFSEISKLETLRDWAQYYQHAEGRQLAVATE